MAYQNRFEIDLLQLFEHPENWRWSSVISFVVFEVNIGAEQKQA